MSTLRTTNLQHNSAADPNIILTTSGDVDIPSRITFSGAGAPVVSGETSIQKSNFGHLTLQSEDNNQLILLDNTNQHSIQLVINDNASTGGKNGVNVRWEDGSDTSTGGNVNAHRVVASTAGTTTRPFQCYQADITATFNSTNRVVGYGSNINVGRNTGSGIVWSNFHQGNAPSYFNGGVQFDLTHSTGGSQAELQLDFYEEGEWTPSFASTAGGGSNPTCTYAADGQQGVYTRVGDIVHAAFALELTNITGGAGVLMIAGLPFSIGTFPDNIVGHGTGGIHINTYSNVTQTNATFPALISGRPRTGTSFQLITTASNGEDSTSLGVNRLQNNTIIRGALTYKV